ncbi:MAG: response regulator transcription factor [Flavobacteriales bacterium]|nr:response regulator transcription factor [Flavobacteriales bacterium]
MEKEKLRLAIVDDHPLVRDGFVRQLENWPYAGEVHQAADGVYFEELCRTVGHFDIVVMDLSMPRRDGYETTQWCTRHHARTKVLGLSLAVDEYIARRIMGCGARGIVSKEKEPQELLRALDHVRTVGFFYNEWVTKALRLSWEMENEAKPPECTAAAITPRERQFLMCYARPPFPQLKEVAVRLGIKYNGAESMRKQVVKRTGCASREQMIDLLRRLGWG